MEDRLLGEFSQKVTKVAKVDLNAGWCSQRIRNLPAVLEAQSMQAGWLGILQQ